MEVASLMARLMVAMVTFPLLGFDFGVSFSFRRAEVLLGVARSGFPSASVGARVSASASSTARRQMSRARRASPETAATFLLANWMASDSTM